MTCVHVPVLQCSLTFVVCGGDHVELGLMMYVRMYVRMYLGPPMWTVQTQHNGLHPQ